MAIACHPDDIDFGMSGTLMMLKKAGYEIHYMDVANGSLGTAEYTYDEIVKIRREEAMNAAKTIGAVLPIVAKKVGLDPAVMAAPIITTIVDALSLLIYFAVACSILPISI